MSTRQIIDDKSNQPIHQFDHGCQSIATPKSNAFQVELDRWKENGWVQPWKGRFGTIGCNDQNKIIFKETMDEEERYVGYPRMNSICENLVLSQSNSNGGGLSSTLEVVTGTHAHATHYCPQESSGDSTPMKMWKLENRKEQPLGNYDWLIVTDRNSAQPHRLDLRNANMGSYAKLSNESMESIKSCTTMVAFDKPLPLSVDAIRLNYDDHHDPSSRKEVFGSLGWIARDSSKPGRQQLSEDGMGECWVLQSHPEAAERILQMEELQNASLTKIREKIRDVMVEDFIQSIPYLVSISNSSNDKNGESSNNENNQQKQQSQSSADIISSIRHSVGHRWGAAFPLHIETQDSKQNPFLDTECHMDSDKQFVACGDYFGEHHGTVEGAFLSGRAAAECLIRQVNE